MNPFSMTSANTMWPTPASDRAWPQNLPEYTEAEAQEHEGYDEGETHRQGVHGVPRRAFRRPRAGRACGTCHSRRVRCDAGSRGLPCSNCEAFSLHCSIPPKKTKKRERDTVSSLQRTRRSRPGREQQPYDEDPNDPAATMPQDFASLMLQADEHIKKQPDMAPTYATLVKQEVAESPIHEPGNVVYLQEFSNMSLLVHNYEEPTQGVHYPMPKIENNSIEISTKMNKVELQILEKRGALSLPPKELCDELVHAYFKWVAPIVPMVNRARFMQQYRDPTNPPSILLMQAILLAGSRVCTTDMLMDSKGSPIPAATLFYKRAKALYDADYEQDRVTIVQALILMGWYWEEAGKVTKNVFYWNGLAVTIAHGCGMHRNHRNSKLSTMDKRLWKRMWWTLYTRDRAVAVALGRPPHIDMLACDMEMLSEEDFLEDDGVPANSLHVQFFLHYVKICEIMDLVLLQNYSISARSRSFNAMALTQCDMALADWIQNCPGIIRWNPSRYNFWAAYLQCIYQTTICLLHRAHLPPAPSPAIFTSLSRSPAFQSAHMITSIVESLVAHDELRYTPPFIIYSILSTLIVHIYQLHIAIPETSHKQIQRISICMSALEDVSEIWLVAKAVQDLFDSVLSSAGLEKTVDLGGRSYYRRRSGPPPEPGLLTTIKKEPMPGNSPQSGDKTAPKKDMPLTPALRIWADVALKSAVTPKVPARSPPVHEFSSNSSTTSKNQEPRQFSKEWNDVSQCSFANHPQPTDYTQTPFDPLLNYGYLPEDRNFTDLSWSPQWIEGTPAPTGYNATEWFQFFGIR